MKQHTSYDEVKEEIKTAIETGDTDAFILSQERLALEIKNSILQEYEEVMIAGNQQAIMRERGINPLTKEEITFYNSLKDGTASLGDMEALMPVTVVNRVFEDLEQNYPLLQAINFVNTTGVTEYVVRTSDSEAAWWGPLCDTIKKKLAASFKIKVANLFKLSAYVPICKAMLDLGPEWLDRFVRIILAESIAMALETAVINGDGNEQPIGFLKDLDGAVTQGVYPDKAKVALPSLQPADLGKHIMAPLTKKGTRTIGDVLLVVNPLDYWEKIYPQTTYLSSAGTYVFGVLPIQANIIQSRFMPVGTMVAGIGKDYDMLVGSDRKVEFSDHYKFLEDERTYITKQYANGGPKDNESFLVFDISNMSIPEMPVA